MPLQRLPKVSAPDDPLEVEAEQVAQRVVAGQPSAPISSTGPPAANQRADDNDDTVFAWLQRLAVGEEEEEVQRVAVGEEEEEEVQRVAVGDDEEEVQRVAVGEDEEDDESVQALLQRLPNGSPTGSSGVASALGSPGPGAPIPPAVRTAIEPGLGVELGGVEVHTGPRAERAADDVQARAFTNRNHVFLNRGESPHDVSLMAHEATHVVQQGAAGKSHRSAGTGADEIQRLPAFIADELAGYARHVPGYTLFTVIIGVNPLTGARVERTPINLVEGVMGLVPFGTAIFDKLVDLGVLQDAFAFVERQLSTFDLSLSRLERLIQEAWDEMDFVRLDPFDYNLGVLVRKFSGLLEDVHGFAASLVDALVQLIKDAAIGVAEDLLADSPAWALIKKVLRRDPLRDEPVEATTVEILEDFLLLIGKEQELEQMRVRGTLQETADWLDTQLATFQGLLSQLGSLFTAAWEAIQPENLPNLIANLRGLADQAIGFLEGVWSFATTVAAKVLELVKKALLGWLSEFAHDVPGFHLLTVILGRNPFTGERVPRSAENLIRGFITLLPGGNAVYDQLAETGVIGEAAARIEGAMSELGISWEMVVGLFRGIWEGLSINDLVDPIGAFTRIRDQFGEPISRLFAFIRVVLREILTLVLAVMNFPSDVIARIVANAMRAYEDIKRNVVGFLINMLAAVKAGFSNFFDNVFDHLLGGLIDWLFRGLRQAGIEPPSELTLETGLDLLLQVLGITTERLWEKLAERIGQERVDQIRGALDRLEGIWTFVTDVQERGVVAIWEYIEGQITNLWDTIIAQVRDWIMEKIISRVTAKLLSMLDPTGVMAVVNSFIAFFNAIQSAVEYMREILDIVDQYVATLAAVARGDIEPGAARLEQGLVSAIPVAIGFLANQVGLGNIGEKITEIVGGLRELVDQALDWLLNQAERMLDALLRTLGFGGTDEQAGEVTAVDIHEPFETRDEDHVLRSQPRDAQLLLESTPTFLDAHPSEEVRRIYSEYLDIVRNTDLAVTPRREQINAKVRQLVTAVKAAGPPEAPGTSAPGIGTVDRHGAQQSRLQRNGIRVWWLESEHVVPRGFIDASFRAMREQGVPMGGPDYRSMHTILIYERAADRKTGGKEGDAAQINNFKGYMDEVAHVFETSGRTLGAARAVVEGVRSLLDMFAQDAVRRTVEAIVDENAEFAALRGPENQPEPPLPPPNLVEHAYLRQSVDAETQLQARMDTAVED